MILDAETETILLIFCNSNFVLLCCVYLFSFPKQIIKRSFIHRSCIVQLSHSADVKLSFVEKEEGTRSWLVVEAT